MSPRLSADERREAVVGAALTEFGTKGYEGTSTQVIADRAGISQPYLFRLYPSKKALFLASIQRSNDRISEAFEQAVEGLYGEEARGAMATVYGELIADRSLLMHQLQAYASCDDPEICAAAREGFGKLWQLVARLGGGTDDEVRLFFAYGMLWNVASAMRLADYDAEWSVACVPAKMRGRGVVG
jgi:AcrR family transcriptional regulator